MILYFKKCNNPLKIKDTYKRIDNITKKFDKSYYFLKDLKEENEKITIPYIFYSYKWYEDKATFNNIEDIKII